MRLIDADELKKCKVYSEERHEYVVAVFNIDNAPVLDLERTIDEAFSNGYRAGTLDALANAEQYKRGAEE